MTLAIFNKLLAFILCIAPVVFATKIQLFSKALSSSFLFCILCVFVAFII